jgi:DhnA family fructose-bisphosphate aldolase class Ia
VLDQMGMQRRLHRLVPSNRPALWLPLDDGLISGPEEHLRDARELLQDHVLDHVTAVLGFRGVLEAARDQLIARPMVMNLSASTTLAEHTRKVPVGSVADAIRADADAVACHVNFTSPYEVEQLEMLSRRVGEAQAFGLPVVAFAYPRTRRPDGVDENYLDLRERDPEEFTRLVRHCVRAAVELGASIVKTIFTGSAETFQTVVQSAMGVPVLIAGEKLTDEDEAIRKAQLAVRAGAAGVAYGRQIFARPDPLPFLHELRKILDDDWATPGSGLTGPPSEARLIVTSDALQEPTPSAY